MRCLKLLEFLLHDVVVHHVATADVVYDGFADHETILAIGPDGLFVALVDRQDDAGIAKLFRPLGDMGNQLAADPLALHVGMDVQLFFTRIS